MGIVRRTTGIVMSIAVCILMASAISISAGSLNSPGAPGNINSSFYTLEDIYNRLNAGTPGTPRVFTEPAAWTDAGVMHTLSEIMGKAPVVDDTNGAANTDVLSGKTFWGLSSGAWGPRTGTMVNVGAQAITPGTSEVTITQGYHNGSGRVATDVNLATENIKSGTTIFGVAGTLLSAQVPRTGQTATLPYPSQPTGSDGDLKKGVAWPEPRFTASNGTVRDNLTGLIWLQNADYNSTTSTTGTTTWAGALSFCNALKSGQCGLNDLSTVGQWRLPNYFELVSLLDLAYANPVLSNDVGTGHYLLGATSSFTGVHSLSTNLYWSSTTRARV